MDIIKSIEHEQMKNAIPDLKVGDTIRVHQRIKEGNRERIQVFEGIIIKKQGGGDNATFTVRRNAYGRQLGSFHTTEEFEGIGKVPMTFIRAPFVEKAEEGVKVLAKADGNIVAVQYKNQIGMSFHPELDEDDRIHQLFLDTVKKNK